MTKQQLISAIVARHEALYRRPCPQIVPLTYYVHCETGARYTVRGGFPHGVGPADCTTQTRYVYTDGNTTYAQEAYYTEWAARAAWEHHEDTKYAEFRALLERDSREYGYQKRAYLAEMATAKA